MIDKLNCSDCENQPKTEPDGICLYRAKAAMLSHGSNNSNAFAMDLVRYNITVRTEHAQPVAFFCFFCFFCCCWAPPPAPTGRPVSADSPLLPCVSNRSRCGCAIGRFLGCISSLNGESAAYTSPDALVTRDRSTVRSFFRVDLESAPLLGSSEPESDPFVRLYILYVR